MNNLFYNAAFFITFFNFLGTSWCSAACQNNQAIDNFLDDTAYPIMAASSEERGYYARKTNAEFHEDLGTLIKSRAQKVCERRGCRTYDHFQTIRAFGQLTAFHVDYPATELNHFPDGTFPVKSFPMVEPWKYVNKNYYQNINDACWISGHILSWGTLLTLANHVASIPFIIVSQCLTVGSRWIGRASNPELDYAVVRRHRASHKRINMEPILGKAPIPHHVFKMLTCIEEKTPLSPLDLEQKEGPTYEIMRLDEGL